MNAKQIMAKFAQLYFQKGKSSPDKRLIPVEYVKKSLTPYTQYGSADYGYLWIGQWGAWCAWGTGGQISCLDYETNRGIVVQNEIFTDGPFDGWVSQETIYEMLPFALRMEVGNATAPPTSGGFSVSVMGVGLAAAAVSFVAVLL